MIYLFGALNMPFKWLSEDGGRRGHFPFCLLSFCAIHKCGEKRRKKKEGKKKEEEIKTCWYRNRRRQPPPWGVGHGSCRWWCPSSWRGGCSSISCGLLGGGVAAAGRRFTRSTAWCWECPSTLLLLLPPTRIPRCSCSCSCCCAGANFVRVEHGQRTTTTNTPRCRQRSASTGSAGSRQRSMPGSRCLVYIHIFLRRARGLCRWNIVRQKHDATFSNQLQAIQKRRAIVPDYFVTGFDFF